MDREARDAAVEVSDGKFASVGGVSNEAEDGVVAEVEVKAEVEVEEAVAEVEVEVEG